MELSKNFEPNALEQKWYQHWLDKQYFNSTPDGREPYTIVIPPPNVTGVLHMGHCLNNTIQDILIRYARMNGQNACWVPGTDHASIATEAKVVAMLREKGITKSSLTREEFLQYAWEWKEKYGGIILQQLKKLGCSFDWSRTSFTMDEDYYKAVIKVFIDLYHKGLIYRGKRMVNWDPVSLTALSDEEVIFKETQSKLYYVIYKFAESDGSITVATTRPETILGDVAICVNPLDERYKSLIGKKVLVPIINRKVPIIADEYVTADFGTGVLKITPAHDKNDNLIGNKYKLKSIDTLDLNGKFTAEELLDESPSQQILDYVGMDRFELRTKIAKDIEALGLLQKTEEYIGQIGTSERTGAVIENKLSLQWFIDMKKFMEKNPQVLSSVLSDEINFHPAKLKNTYKYWLENIKDWCISRQLWWGQRIPAWYDEQGNCMVAGTEGEAKKLFAEKFSTFNIQNSKITQDEDVLDTWFSSWLWPIEVFKGISQKGNADANYYYPTTTLVTGQDIIFFWVARMIMAGYEYENQPPFKDVYFTGMVRDKQGRKMSKQLVNSPDLLRLIDQYGADAVRFGILISAPAGNDLLFDESALEQGRNFNNKMWNALKLVKMWETRKTTQPVEVKNEFATEWFAGRLNEAKTEVDNLIKQFRLSEALKTIYSLIWDDFCSWYLEWVKPAFEQPMETPVYEKTIGYFSELMQLLHPFMPFITEEIYQQLTTQKGDLCVTQYPSPEKINQQVLQNGILLKTSITGLRDVRNKQQLKPKDAITLHIQTANEAVFKAIVPILAKQVNAKSILFTQAAINNTITCVIGKDKFYLETEQPLNTEKQKADLEKELLHHKGFLATVDKKLGNEKFVQNAKPEVIALEKKKKADAEMKIKIIEESLATL
ncbi:MAG: valine--tRNA ligase [Chitinophagaceae bacterium]|nr:valine--tRNA ligase [Chitinophagaceae bacterium]